MKLCIQNNFFDRHDVSSEIIKILSETHEIIIYDKYAIDNNLFDWINRNINHLITKKQCVQYAVYAAELTLPIFEKEHPEDNRSRIAIEAVKRWIKNPSKENVDAASLAASDLSSYTDSSASLAASDLSSYTDSSAYWAASTVQWASCSNAYFTAADARSAAHAASASGAANATSYASTALAASSEISVKIINYGLELLLKGE